MPRRASGAAHDGARLAHAGWRSDLGLHAWDWALVDTVHWLDAHVPRPKTKSGDRMALPDALVPVLRAWWDSHGRPLSGPVFPVSQRGPAGPEEGQGGVLRVGGSQNPSGSLFRLLLRLTAVQPRASLREFGAHILGCGLGGSAGTPPRAGSITQICTWATRGSPSHCCALGSHCSRWTSSKPPRARRVDSPGASRSRHSRRCQGCGSPVARVIQRRRSIH
jgi:hypothetical protein